MANSYRSYSLKTPRFRISPAYPVSIFEPAVFSAFDSYAINGHGFDFDGDAHIKAIGEYLERYAAFRTISHTHTGRIGDTGLSGSEQEALSQALEETCPYESLRVEISNHIFKLVEVRRLATGERCLFPAVFLSLHSFNGCRDTDFLPIRDTSGSAIHPDRDTAFRSALLEFVERQCTTAMWVSRRCNAIGPMAERFTSHKKASVTCRQMARRGDLIVYDISFLTGVSVFFGVFRSRAGGDIVNFACGCAAEFSENNALLKAFTEVWQTSLLLPQMQFFGTHEYGSDKLKEDFKAANRPGFDLDVMVRPLHLGCEYLRCEREAALAANLLEISSNIYIYEKDIVVSGIRFRFCRIVSPDFFVHMSPGEGNNNDNKWINRFCRPEDRRIEPLPFS